MNVHTHTYHIHTYTSPYCEINSFVGSVAVRIRSCSYGH